MRMMSFSHSPLWRSRLVAPVWTVKALAMSVMLRGLCLFGVRRRWCVAEAQVSGSWYFLLLAVGEQGSVQHPVSAIKACWACYDLIKWGLRPGRMRCLNEYRGHCGRRRSSKHCYYRVNSSMHSEGFCFRLGWRDHVYCKFPVLPVGSLVWLQIIVLIESSTGLVFFL